MKKYLIPFLIFALLTSSCELVVDVDVPLERPKLTLNSLFTPDSVWYAELYFSRHILDQAQFKPVADGNIAVYKDGLLLETLENKGSGIYLSASGRPIAGEAYELRAESPTYGTVNGTSFAPAPAKIEDVEVVIPASTPGSPFPTNEMANFTIKFADKAEESNYYIIHIILEYTYTYRTQSGTTVTTKHRRPLYLESTDTGIGDESDGSLKLFSDLLFDGKDVTMHFKSYMRTLGPEDKLFIHLGTASEDYYQYKKTLQLQQESSGDPFAQPVNVYNNIQNGYGVVAGYSEDVVEYK